MKIYLIPVFLFLSFLLLNNVYSVESVNHGGDPHDSLLYDGSNVPIFFDQIEECAVRVKSVKGKVTGTVMRKFISPKGCEKGFDTTYISKKDQQLQVGDIMSWGSDVVTGVDSEVKFDIITPKDFNSPNKGNSTIDLHLYANSKMVVPAVGWLCMVVNDKSPRKPEEDVVIIKGVVTYETEEDELTPLPKIKTRGKKAVVEHTKTLYSHEVKIEGADILDVIRVFKGSVEVSYITEELMSENDKEAEMERLSEQMQEGKLSMEELSIKMNEIMSYSQNITELMQPVTVNEGSMCTVGRNTRVIEVLDTNENR